MLLAMLLTQAAAPAPCLPPSLSGWEARGTALDSGRAVTMPAVGQAAVRLVGVPEPKGGDKLFALRFTIRQAGSYGIALDQKGWIDVYPAPRVAGTVPPTALTSTAHGHGPECSTIRKIVRYSLARGSYQLVVSGLQRSGAKVMLVTEPS